MRAGVSFKLEDAWCQAGIEEIGDGGKGKRKAVVVSVKALGEDHDFPGLNGFDRSRALGQWTEGQPPRRVSSRCPS